MDHRQARKTGWTIVGCGCVFIILTKVWIGLAMVALGLVLGILGGAAPTAEGFCCCSPQGRPSVLSATGRCKGGCLAGAPLPAQRLMGAPAFPCAFLFRAPANP